MKKAAWNHHRSAFVTTHSSRFHNPIFHIFPRRVKGMYRSKPQRKLSATYHRYQPYNLRSRPSTHTSGAERAVTSAGDSPLHDAHIPDFEQATHPSNAQSAHVRKQSVLELMPMANAIDTHPLHDPHFNEEPHPGRLLQLRKDLLGLHFNLINTLHHSAHSVEALDEPDPKAWNVELHYPSGYTERFRLNPSFRSSRRARSARSLEPFDDIFQTLNILLLLIKADPELRMSLLTRFDIAWKNDSPELFKPALQHVNEKVDEQVRNQTISPYLGGRLPPDLITHFFDQLYDRAVSPHLNGLKSGKSDNVYGEIKPSFLSAIFQALSLNEKSIYLDLGSGVGNTVMQAALETGCEAHGIEMAQYPHLIGAYHLQQFHARCALWALHPGNVTLHFGDFLKSQLVSALLSEVDAVLINNVKFEPSTDANLYSLLAKKLTIGAKVFSMRPLTPIGRARSPTSSSLVSGDGLFLVDALPYHEGYVSWTDTAGVAYVSTKRRSAM